MKVIIYARVSTDGQELDNQLQAMRQWIEDNGHELIEEYQEHESAWRQGHQRELKRLFDDLQKRKTDAVLVWSLDRLSREGVGKLFELVGKFRRRGVQLISLQEQWLSEDGVAADLLIAVTGWIAAFESKRLSERTKAGLARAVSEGKRLGRPPGSKDSKKRKRSGYLLRYSPEMRDRYDGK